MLVAYRGRRQKPNNTFKIKKIWPLYPRIRKIMQLVAENNDAEFIDLSVIFKDEKKSSINFFDKAHLTVTGQKKVAMVFAEKIKNTSAKKPQNLDAYRLSRKVVHDILALDFSGEYTTIEDY